MPLRANSARPAVTLKTPARVSSVSSLGVYRSEGEDPQRPARSHFKPALLLLQQVVRAASFLQSVSPFSG